MERSALRQELGPHILRVLFNLPPAHMDAHIIIELG